MSDVNPISHITFMKGDAGTINIPVVGVKLSLNTAGHAVSYIALLKFGDFDYNGNRLA